ncbi:MAG: hypothetical protein GF390_04020, partial [Candidatus Pacebacteria bacterium]|nr:hypothetical protein [Candidatus Paceibacterota bacterium]
PLFYELKNQGHEAELLGRQALHHRVAQNQGLKDGQVVVTATGVAGLVTGELISSGTIVIDAGEPQPDVDFASVRPKASFITPVPGGVGPVTVSCLLENSLDLCDILSKQT